MPPRLQLASSDRSRKCLPHACLCSRHPHGSALISFRPLSSKTSHLKQQALPLSHKCTYYSKKVYFKLIMIYCSFLCLCVLVSMCGQFLSRTGDVQTRWWVQDPGHPSFFQAHMAFRNPWRVGHRRSVFSVENVALTWNLLSLQSLQQVDLWLQTVASSGRLVETEKGMVLRVRTVGHVGNNVL